MIPIKQIKLRKMKMKLKQPFSTSFGTVQEKEFFIIEVTDGSLTGYGESVAFTTPWYTEETTETVNHVITEFLIPLLKKHPIRHPDDVTHLFQSIRRHNMAKSAVEGAIWDLYAKRNNQSLLEAIGGRQIEAIGVGLSIGIQPTMDKLLASIDEAVQQGYKRVKIKIDRHHDIDVVSEVRRHFPDISLMVDANSAYTLRDIDHLKKLDDYNLMMIEQPLGHDDILEHAQLQKIMKTPICLDESIHSLRDVKLAIQLKSCQIINVKIGRVGGLTEAVRIHDFCQKHDVAVWCGGMLESGIGRSHNMALASLPQFTLPGDIGGSAHYWIEDIIKPEVVVKNGMIDVPKTPGIGFEVDQELLDKYTVDAHVYSI